MNTLLDSFTKNLRQCTQCETIIMDSHSYMARGKLYHEDCLSKANLTSASAYQIEMNSFASGIQQERAVWIEQLKTLLPSGDCDAWSAELREIKCLITVALLKD